VRRAAAVVTAAGLGATTLLATGRVRAVLTDPTPLTPYKEPQWWLDYDAGFVRRGLPGEVLSWVAGGPPDRGLVAAAGTALTLAAVLAVVALAVALARSAPTRAAGVLVATVVVASPLTVSLLLHDVGRYDGLGVLALAMLALTPARQPSSAVGAAVAVVVTAVVVTAVTAAQELLLPVLAPAALARVGALPVGPAAGAGSGSAGLRARLAVGTAALGPAAGVAVASALLPAPASAVTDARGAAVAAGVPRQGGWGDALDAVDRTLVENVAFFGFFEPAALAWSALLWAGLYAATAAVLARLLGRGHDRTWWVLAAWQAAVAAGLSLLGVDFRRWWGLALLGLVAAAAVTRPGAVTAVEAGPRSALAAAHLGHEAAAAQPRRGSADVGTRRGSADVGTRRGSADVGTRLMVAVGALLALGFWAADLPVFPVTPGD
jgi:hypothetical protein